MYMKFKTSPARVYGPDEAGENHRFVLKSCTIRLETLEHVFWIYSTFLASLKRLSTGRGPWEMRPKEKTHECRTWYEDIKLLEWTAVSSNTKKWTRVQQPFWFFSPRSLARTSDIFVPQKNEFDRWGNCTVHVFERKIKEWWLSSPLYTVFIHAHQIRWSFRGLTTTDDMEGR